MEQYGFDYSQVSYMGDDEPDIAILQNVGLSACPNDAVDDVQKVCDFKSKFNGGHGAVRELCDLIYKSQKQ